MNLGISEHDNGDFSSSLTEANKKTSPHDGEN